MASEIMATGFKPYKKIRSTLLRLLFQGVVILAAFSGLLIMGGLSVSRADGFGLPDHQLDPVTAELRFRYFGYAQEGRTDTENHSGAGQALVTLSGTVGERFTYFLSPQFRMDTGNLTDIAVEFREKSLQRPAFTLQEAIATYSIDSYEFTAGKKIYSWGVADGYNPLDNINPLAMLDAPTADKIGVPSLSFFRYGEKLDLQLVIIPFFTPSRMPEDQSNRWTIQSSSGLQQVADAYGMWPTVDYQGRSLPDDSLKNFQYGLRLSSSTLVSGWDLALCFYRGLYPTGVLATTVTPPSLSGGLVVPPQVRIRKEYPLFNEAGGSFSTTSGAWEWHGEGAYHWTEDREMDEDFFEYIAGFNYTYPGEKPGFLNDIILTLEYAGLAVTRERPAESQYSDSGYRRHFRNTLLANLSLKFSDDTNLELAGVTTLAAYDFFYDIHLKHKINDNIACELGYQGFEGSADSFFGQWDENDRLYLCVTIFI